MPHWVKNELTKLGGTAQEQAREWIVKALFLSPLGFLYGFRDYFLRLIESILTKPIRLWHIPEILFALCYIIAVSSFTFLLGKRAKISLSNPTAIESVQSNNKKVTFATKFDPPEPIRQEKFHTFDGVTFKYHLDNGFIFPHYFCSKHFVQLIDRTEPKHRLLNMSYYKCPICKELLLIGDQNLKDITKGFHAIMMSFIAGHLKELPTKSEP
jgi:hypothetical protein